MSPFNNSKFANSAHKQASSYERRFRKYVPFSEIIDALRRQAAFDLPLKFVLDRDPDSSGFFKRGVQWDFGNAGVRFEKKEAGDSLPVLVVAWSSDAEQKSLQGILDELNELGFAEDATVSIELVSPSGERMLSRYGNGVSVGKDGTTIHLTGSWQAA